MSLPSPQIWSRNTNERQALILATALHLFTTRGYFNTSVHDIRRKADISIGSIYHHFKNKEAIAKALYDELLAGMAAAFEEIALTSHSAHDRCRAVVAHLFDLTETVPEAAKFVLSARHQEFLPGEKPVCSSRPLQLMKEMVEEGIDQREIRPMPPLMAAACLFGGPIRLISLRLDGIIEEPLEHYLEGAWKCAWRSVAA